MSIRVKFFASLREQVGRPEQEILSNGVRTVSEVWAQIDEGELPASVLCAINMDYAESDSPVKDGDEVAFFPPVTGG